MGAFRRTRILTVNHAFLRATKNCKHRKMCSYWQYTFPAPRFICDGTDVADGDVVICKDTHEMYPFFFHEFVLLIQSH